MLVNNMKNHKSIWTEFKHSFKRGIFSSSTALLIGTFASQSFAAPQTLEIFSGSASTLATGPTNNSQVHTYRLNANNPTNNSNTAYTPTTTVTYSISSDYKNSTYINQGTTLRDDFMFGGGLNSSGTSVRSVETFQPLSGIDSPQDRHFAATAANAPTSCTNGNPCSSTNGGISVVSNYAVSLYAATRTLRLINASRSGTHKIGRITATFNRAVNNPVLHLASMGGSSGSLGFSAQLRLVASSGTGVSMRRIAGSSELNVSGNDITNNASTIGATTGSGAASGSVLVSGTNITSLTFDVYIRGDGRGTSWESSNSAAGDSFYFGVSSMDAESQTTPVGTLIPDANIAEARFEIVPNIPTIVRGTSGTQTITVTNRGPNTGTNTVAYYTPQVKQGVTVTNVRVAGGDNCDFSSGQWTCPAGTVASGGSFQLLVDYSTTAAGQANQSALGQNVQGTVRVGSNEFNPGSGMGETLYKGWGSNEKNETRENGAFWVRDSSTSYYNENQPLLPVWPVNQAGPDGQYLSRDPYGVAPNAVYKGLQTNAPPMIQRLINDMSTDPYRTLNLLLVGGAGEADDQTAGDNRRAWEFTTGVYIPSGTQSAQLCIGNETLGVDDGGYIMVNGQRVALTNGWAKTGLATSYTLSQGYNRITYRIVNRNTANSSANSERSPAGYGPISLSFDGTCNPATYDAAIRVGVPVSINIIDGAKIKIAIRSVGGAGEFTFSGLTNLQNATGDATTDAITTTTAGTAVNGTQFYAKSQSTAVTITEDTLAGYTLTGASCVKSGSATTFGSLSGSTLTIPSAQLTTGSDITCTFTNQKRRNLTIQKSWVNAKLNDAVNITATGLTDFSAIAETASEIDSAGAKLATVGTQITIAESFTTGSSANYNASLQCMTERTTPTVVTVTNNQITMPDENVTCTYTNSRIAQQLNLKKQWQNATLNHSASVTTTGATNNPTFNSTATSAGNNATTGTAVTVYAGDVVTLPAETFAGGAIASNYTATVACAGGSMLASGATGRTLTISNNTTATECTYTNTNNLKLTDLSITKTDNVDSVYNDTDTTYTIVVTNAGPNAADGAIFKDPVATGLTKSTIACSATGGAVCPTAANLTIANIESTNGLAIPTLPNGGVVTFTIEANVTATSGNVSNVATVTAPSGTTDPVSINDSATDTDSVLTPIVIQGKVFEDNSGTTGIASNAYNAVQNTGEVGIANSTVQLTNCSGTVLATTETDAIGQYQFAVSQATLPSPNFCVVQTNVEGYTSVSGTTGYTRSTDTITVATSGGTYTDLNFGDAKLNLVLTESGQHTVVAGAVTDYPHRLQTDATVQVTGITQTLNQQPSSASDQDWQALVYRDSNCNGTVDAGENLFNPSTSAPVSLLPSADICLVQRVHVPTNIYAGAQHNAQLEASYSVALSNPAQAITGTSNQVQDTTLLGSAGLELSKKVRKVASCPSTAADTAVFSTVNEATTLDKLEYEITYKNNSVKNLQNVKVKDSVPTGTTFASISCQSTPSGNSCTPTRTGEALLWQLTGNLTPASSGTVRFCVTPQ